MPISSPLIARLLLAGAALLLTACDKIPGMGPDPAIARREAEAKAIGGGCRHGLRSIEDCYNLNERASKSAIFEGWKEMDQYMRDNKIEGVRAVEAHSEPTEQIIPDDKAKTGAKASAEGKDKPSATKPKSPEKPADQPTEKPVKKTAQ
ncbi:hypothetical protein [Rhodoferax sp.]|uniref:hypothetical protein n=1 Tax=Rhodoferax sp. TaxID=50421 RepID=UPI00275E1814|nr:hypothetical protein [Rhodoferax sp.]